jgi:hypothetical protein
MPEKKSKCNICKQKYEVGQNNCPRCNSFKNETALFWWCCTYTSGNFFIGCKIVVTENRLKILGAERYQKPGIIQLFIDFLVDNPKLLIDVPFSEIVDFYNIEERRSLGMKFKETVMIIENHDDITFPKFPKYEGEKLRDLINLCKLGAW